MNQLTSSLLRLRNDVEEGQLHSVRLSHARTMPEVTWERAESACFVISKRILTGDQHSRFRVTEFETNRKVDGHLVIVRVRVEFEANSAAFAEEKVRAVHSCAASEVLVDLFVHVVQLRPLLLRVVNQPLRTNDGRRLLL